MGLLGNQIGDQDTLGRDTHQMESFAAKVRFGSGPRFDPMMEERGGWIAGEAHRYDSEMTDAIIEVMAEVNAQTSKDDLNPFKAQIGEILPSNLERNFSGFLMRKDAISFKVNSEELHAWVPAMKEQLLLGKFVGPKPQTKICTNGYKL